MIRITWRQPQPEPLTCPITIQFTKRPQSNSNPLSDQSTRIEASIIKDIQFHGTDLGNINSLVSLSGVPGVNCSFAVRERERFSINPCLVSFLFTYWNRPLNGAYLFLSYSPDASLCYPLYVSLYSTTNFPSLHTYIQLSLSLLLIISLFLQQFLSIFSTSASCSLSVSV